ncbi:uncharacterized protein LOC131282787 [Anopheles ziemanni]|uniref:uncharacterized protein LOC131267416 n=1 Tax=Anopheles coustani TaxID=139045 RepID=UPI002659D52A|nr:uncharacterized protein LOC131267416 [Anopheles coustani]XP_058168313.1 uncharacterized protein LOC131282787 [Anopheles ziemanni]
MAMDKYLRQFIKYQPYTIVIFTMIMVAILTPMMGEFEAHDIENFRFGGAVAVTFGVSWFLAVVLLVVAIHKEDKRFIYPYLVLFGIDLFLLILRELYVMFIDRIYVEFLSIKMMLAAIIVPYVIGSLLALHRLFTVDPIVTLRSEGFVRFDRNEVVGGQQTTAPEPSFSPPNDYVRRI